MTDIVKSGLTGVLLSHSLDVVYSAGHQQNTEALSAAQLTMPRAGYFR